MTNRKIKVILKNNNILLIIFKTYIFKRVLNIVLGDNQSEVTSKYRLTLKFDDEAGYLAALLKLILPISYHVI